MTQAGKAVVSHRLPVPPEHLAIMHEAIKDGDCSRLVTYRRFMATGVNLGPRGQAEHHDLKRSDFKLMKAADGTEFVRFSRTTALKNYTGAYKDGPPPGDVDVTPNHLQPAFCLVAAVKEYDKVRGGLWPSGSRFTRCACCDACHWCTCSPGLHLLHALHMLARCSFRLQAFLCAATMPATMCSAPQHHATHSPTHWV